MATTTPSAMILSSMRKSGVRALGGTLSTAENAAYLADMNSMIDSWSIDPAMISQLLQESLALTASVGSYTIGPGSSTWNTAKPVKIVDPCFVRDSNNNDFPLEIIDDAAYGGIALKSSDGGYPAYLNYRVGASTGTINLYPEPVASLTLYINSWKSLQQFQAVTTVLEMAAGMQRCIEFNFSVEMTGFKNADRDVLRIARESLIAVKKMNLSNKSSGILSLDAGVVGARRSSILTG